MTRYKLVIEIIIYLINVQLNIVIHYFTGMNNDIGSTRVGEKADLAILNKKSLRNFKVLYGTGHFRLSDNKPIRADGMIHDAKALLSDVRKLVAQQKTIFQ